MKKLKNWFKKFENITTNTKAIIVIFILAIFLWFIPKFINWIDCKFFNQSICTYRSYKNLIYSLCEKGSNYGTSECKTVREKEPSLSSGYFGDE